MRNRPPQLIIQGARGKQNRERVHTMSGNVYYECRKRAAKSNDRLNSRAGAAEFLGVSESSLTHYELGIAKSVPVDVVVMMSELYNAPELKYNYCKTECPIGRTLPLATEQVSLPQATVHLLGSMDFHQLAEYTRKLLKVAEDGEISDDEVSEVEPILKDLESISTAVSELRVLLERKSGSTDRGCL